jgi:hypothetical protein
MSLDLLLTLAPLVLVAALRLIFGPYVRFVDVLIGKNGHNTLFTVTIRRSPLQAAVFAQELWESNHSHLRLLPSSRRKMEIFSHEVEVQAAQLLYGVPHAQYRMEESRRMTGYPHLKGMTPEEIERAMRAQAGEALKWVYAHKPLLERAKTK